MKIRYLIIVSLIIAIFTMGAINASDNLTDSDSGILQEDSNPIQEDKTLTFPPYERTSLHQNRPSHLLHKSPL